MVENQNNDDPTMAGPNRPGADAPDEQRTAPAAPLTDVQAYIGRQLRAVYDDVASSRFRIVSSR